MRDVDGLQLVGKQKLEERRESERKAGERKRELEKEGEGKCQLLLECRSNMQQRGRGRCVCVRGGVRGFYAQFKLLLFKDASSCVGNLATVGLNY